MSALLDKLRRTPRRLYFPAGDLGLDQDAVQGLSVPDDIPIVLGLNVAQTSGVPRILQATPAGALTTTRPQPTQWPLIPSRTDTVSVDLGPFVTPAFTALRVYIAVTAISGTGASLTVSILGQTSKGTYSTAAGGGAASAITSATDSGIGLGGANTGAATLLPPLFIIRVVIAGTTPSITWYADLNYQ